jgi:hypothetical protein
MSDPSNSTNAPYFRDGIPIEGWTVDDLPGARFRGDRPTGRYVACVGASQTFGRHVTRPWPELLDRPTMNLGLGDASPATFLDPRLLLLINAAAAAVVQVMTARNCETSAWQPHANEAGLVGTYLGRRGARAPEAPFLADEAWRSAIDRPSRAWQLRSDARSSWLRDWSRLLLAIEVPIVVVWIGKPPLARITCETLHGFYGGYPHLVDRRLAGLGRTIDCTVIRDWPGYYPDDATHAEVAALVRRRLGEQRTA